MSEVSGGPGWWQASDGKWYAPDLRPGGGSQPSFTPMSDPGQNQPGMQQPSGFGQQPYQAANAGQMPPQNTPYQPGVQNWGQPPQNQVAPVKKGKGPLIIFLIIILILILGGGGLAYVLLSSNSDSPTGVVNDFTKNLIAGDVPAFCKDVDPSSQSVCNKEFTQLKLGKGTGSFSAANYVVSGNEALVAVVGKGCGKIFDSSGNSCQSNSDVNSGLPTAQESFQTAWNKIVHNQGSSSFASIPCIKVNGKWYVDLGATIGNSGNSGTTTTTGNSGNSGSSGTSTTTGNSGSSGSSGTSTTVAS